MTAQPASSAPVRNLVTGGAGFVGSHLVDRLMQAGQEVICLDNYFTGRKANIAQWIGHPRFELIQMAGRSDHDTQSNRVIAIIPTALPESKSKTNQNHGIF